MTLMLVDVCREASGTTRQYQHWAS